MSDATNRNERSRTLTVRVGTPEDAFDELGERFAALDAGEHPEALFEVVFGHEEDLQRVLSPRNLRLIRVVARRQPSSIRETARLVGRDVHQVHDNLHDLARLNLINFERDGRAMRPTVWYDDIEIELPISDHDRSLASEGTA